MKVSTSDIALFVLGLGLTALGLLWTTITPPDTLGVCYAFTVTGTSLAGYVTLRLLAVYFGILKISRDW